MDENKLKSCNQKDQKDLLMFFVSSKVFLHSEINFFLHHPQCLIFKKKTIKKEHTSMDNIVGVNIWHVKNKVLPYLQWKYDVNLKFVKRNFVWASISQKKVFKFWRSSSVENTIKYINWARFKSWQSPKHPYNSIQSWCIWLINLISRQDVTKANIRNLN